MRTSKGYRRFQNPKKTYIIEMLDLTTGLTTTIEKTGPYKIVRLAVHQMIGPGVQFVDMRAKENDKHKDTGG